MPVRRFSPGVSPETEDFILIFLHAGLFAL